VRLGKYVITTLVMEYMVSAAMAAKETSMPPAASTIITPSANRPSVVQARTMSNSTASWKKAGLIRATVTTTSRIRTKVNSEGFS
jgi:hypothetical protein